MTHPIAPATAGDPPLMTQRQTRLVMLAMLGTLLLGILDMNIVTSAATSIGRALDPAHGVSQVPWLVTAYVLASSVVQPIYGKLADRHGVRIVFLATLGLFLAGSVLCGLATSMGELIIFRAIQGLGGGGLMSVTMIAIGHLVIESGEKRGASAFAGLLVGMGLVVGPLLGGLLVDHASWRWVFYVNLPLGGLAWLLVAKNLRLPHATTVTRLDALGGVILSITAACLLLVCEWGGHRYGWTSATILGLAAGGALGAALFVWRQTTAPEPFFPPRLLRHRTLRVITVLQLVAGIGLASSIVYMTLALQLIHHASPTSTGLRLIPLALGLALGATVGARVLRRGGPVRLAIAIGQAIGGAALLMLAAVGVEASTVLFDAGLVAFGLGLGLGLGNELLLVQTSVDRTDLGMATAGMRFIETIGASIGASAFGILFSAVTRHATSTHTVSTAIDWIFAVGGVMLLAACLVALRLPDVRYPTAGEVAKRRAPENEEGRAEARPHLT